MAGGGVELQDQRLQRAPSFSCLELGALAKPTRQGQSPAWLCMPGSVLSAAAPASLEHREAPFHPKPQRRQLVQLLGLANPAEVSQHCTAPLSHACPHPLWGWGVLVTTMDVPLPLSPALPLQQHPRRPQRDSTEQMGSGHFRERLGCYLHAEDGLQLILHTDKQQLCCLPAPHPAPAPGLCMGQAVSVGHVGDAGKALSQGRSVRM